MTRPPPARLALFALACALLVAAALGSPSRERTSGPPAAPASGARAPRPPLAARRIERRAARLEAGLRAAARPFLAAFLRYEAGAGGAAMAAALRAGATRGFAARLLAEPPRSLSPAGDPPPARLGSLQLAFLSARGDRALVRASAVRGGAPEQLSFLFARRGGRWLAIGPGQ